MQLRISKSETSKKQEASKNTQCLAIHYQSQTTKIRLSAAKRSLQKTLALPSSTSLNFSSPGRPMKVCKISIRFPRSVVFSRSVTKVLQEQKRWRPLTSSQSVQTTKSKSKQKHSKHLSKNWWPSGSRHNKPQRQPSLLRTRLNCHTLKRTTTGSLKGPTATSHPSYCSWTRSKWRTQQKRTRCLTTQTATQNTMLLATIPGRCPKSSTLSLF